MAFKFVFISLMAIALIATSRAGVIGGSVTYANAPVVTKVANPAVDAVASTHQNVVRSFGGTVSQYSKTVDTPYSSVRKEDTRISNNVYAPAIQAKTVTYAAAPVKTVTYATAPAQTATTVYTHSAPVVASKALYAAPSAAVYTEHQEPAAAVYTTHHGLAHHETHAPNSAAAAVYTHAEPIATKTVSYASPVAHAEPAHVYHSYQHAAPTTTTYNHAPDASTYTHNAPGIAAYGSSQTVRYSPAEMVSHMSFDGFGTHWGF